MKVLRQSYQEWLGKSIKAKRAKLRGEAKEPPIPVHTTKAVSFWDIFPEDPDIYNLVVQARAFQILCSDINLATKEPTIRYKRQTTVDLENVDIASNWEEVTQVLEVRACLEDKEEIGRQVNAIYQSAETEVQKQQLYQQLTNYLQQRAEELEKLGGKESPLYAREKNIVRNVIEKYKLPTSGTQTTPTMQTPLFIPVETPQPEPIAEKAHDSSNAQPAVTSPVDTNGGSLQQLKELMAMYKEGLLSKEEFEAAKTKLLGL
jgi:hypothetical protein